MTSQLGNRISNYILIMTILIAPLFGNQNNNGRSPEIIKLEPQLYRIVMPYKLRTNTGLFVGKEGLLVIDPGFKETVTPLKAQIKKIENASIRYLVNTHPHGDHTQGNTIMEKETTLISHERLDSLTQTGVLKQVAVKRPKKNRFKVYYRLNFNGEEIRIYPAGGTHSNRDIITHFVNKRVVFMGDLLLSESFPAVSKNIKAYLGLLENVVAYFPDNALYVSGHGKDLSKKQLNEYLNMLQTTKEIVLRELNKGKSLEQIRKEDPLKAYAHYNHRLDWLTTDYWIRVVSKYLSK